MDKNFLKGNELYENKDYEKAIKQFEKVEIKSKNYVMALYNIGACLIKMKKYDEALKVLKNAVELDNTHQKAFFNIGYCYHFLGDLKKALIYFNTAWAMANDDKDCEKAIDIVEKKLCLK